MKKAELLDLFRGKCKHGHLWAEHPMCYMKEKAIAEPKIGYIDIETHNLKANFGIMLSYAIKERGTDKIYCDTITKKDIDKKTLDKRLVKKCIADMKRFDVVMGYYSTKFDIPFIRSRAMYWDLDFPMYGELQHKDIYYMVRGDVIINIEITPEAMGVFDEEGSVSMGITMSVLMFNHDKPVSIVLPPEAEDAIEESIW